MAEQEKEAGTALVNTAMVKQANVLALYDKIKDPQAYFTSTEMCKAASSILSAPLDQGPAILLHCMCRGIDVFELAREFDWIMGKPCMKPAAMLSNFRRNFGGKHKRIKQDEKCAEIELATPDGEVERFSFSRRDAMLSRWPWIKDNGGWKKFVPEVRKRLDAGEDVDKIWADMAPYFKDNWGTETDWRSMLYSRCVGNAMRAVCPELAAGIYTPEEMMDVDAIDVAYTTSKAPITAEEFVKQQQAAPPEPVESEPVMDAEFTPAQEAGATQETPAASDSEPAPAAPPAEPPAPSPAAPGSISDADRQLIEQLFDACGVSPEHRERALAARNCNVVRNLSHNDAQTLIQRLRELNSQQQASAGNE